MSKSDSSSQRRYSGNTTENGAMPLGKYNELSGLKSKDAALVNAQNLTSQSNNHDLSPAQESSSDNAFAHAKSVNPHDDSFVEAVAHDPEDSSFTSYVHAKPLHQQDSKLIKDVEPEYIDADVIEDDELAKLEEHFKSSFENEFTDAEAIEPQEASVTQVGAVESQSHGTHDKIAGSSHAVAIASSKSTALVEHQSTDLVNQPLAVASKASSELDDGEHKHDSFDVFNKVKELTHEHDGYDLDDSDHEEELDLESSSYGNFEDEDDSEAEHDDFASNESGMHVFEHDGQDSLDDDGDGEQDYSSTTPNLPVTHGDGHKKPSTALVKASSTAGIGAFIKAANMVPMLSEEEEEELARRFREDGDLSAARRLVESHLRLVIKEARGFAGYGLPLSDLIQEGNIGLMKAVKRFEPEKGARLSTFSRTYILSEIYEYIICNWRMVKVATTKAQRKILFNLNKFKNELRRFTASERNDVAASLGVSASDVAEMEKRLSGSDIGFDLDEADSSEKGVAVAMSPSAYLEDDTSDFAKTYEQSNYAAWEMKKLREALKSLDDRSRYIIKRRWLDEQKATLQELSNEFNISIERVRQVESNAMAKVKAILLNEGVQSDEYSDTPALADKSSKRKGKKAVSVRHNQTERSASTQLKRHAIAGSGVKALPNKKSVRSPKGEELASKIAASSEPLKKRRGRKKASTSASEAVRSTSAALVTNESTALLPSPKSS